MPVYIYQNPKTKEVIELVQSIHDAHEHTDESGLKWNRVYTVPQVGIDTKLDAFSSGNDFVEKTRNKKDSIGHLWDRSKELSEKRKSKFGEDKLKTKYLENWSTKRKGRKPPPTLL
jgi:predicted nucleic acid-binding Zn ribbon protein